MNNYTIMQLFGCLVCIIVGMLMIIYPEKMEKLITNNCSFAFI